MKTEYEHVSFEITENQNWWAVFSGHIRIGSLIPFADDGKYALSPHCKMDAAELREIADFLDALNKEGA